MSMSRRPRTRKLNPDDVLAGRGKKLSARELCSLIHEVNPSGLPLPAAEAARRYAQKSRLQSLLLRRFPSEIEIRPEPQQEGVISLRHRPTGADACHAILASLDDDARSFAQREIDLGGVPSSHPTPPRAPPPRGRPAPPLEPAPISSPISSPSSSPSSSPLSSPPSSATAQSLPLSELLRVGERAVEVYDYPIAQRRLAIALERSGGAAGPAAALLSLLVEHLGADRDALAVQARLSADALAEPEVRRLLALAAARLADRDSALKLTRNLPAPQVAEVFAALARAGIDSGDLEAAARDLAQSAALDPLRADLAGLTDLLQKRRAEQRGPLEDEVRRLVAEGRFVEAEPRAAELLRRWPESPAGRSAQRALEEHRRSARARELYAKADEAIAKGEAAVALSLLHQALASGLSGETAEAARRRVTELEIEARERRARAEIEQICRLLGEADLTEGLRAYLTLRGPRRREVRERVAIPHLGWLEEALARGAKPAAAVLAVLALARASEIARTSPGPAIDLLTPHSKALQGIGAARDVLKEARERLDEQRREAARARVEAARRALDEGGEGAAARAEEILAGASLRDLPEAVRAEVEDLRARIKGAIARQALVATFENYRRGRMVLLARNTADELARTAPDEGERQRWTTLGAELREVIQRLFHVQVFREPSPAGGLVDFTPPRRDGALRLLLPGGRRMVLAQAFGKRVFVRIVDLESATISACIALHEKGPVDLIRAEVRGERVSLVARRGMVLEIGLEGGEVMRRYPVVEEESIAPPKPPPPKPAAPPGEPPKEGEGAPVSLQAVAGTAEEETVEIPDELLVDARIAPGGRFYWVVWRATKGRQGIRIMSVEGPVTSRDLAMSRARVFVSPLLGTKEPRVAVFFSEEDELALFDVRGAPVEGSRARLRAIPKSLAACPDGEHIFLLAREPRKKGSDGAEDAGWVCLPLHGAERSASRRVAREEQRVPIHRVDGLHPETPVAVATNAAARMIFVLFGSASGGRELLGLEQPAEPARLTDLRQVFRVPAPRWTALVEEPGSGRVVAVVTRDDGVELVDLGRDPPSLRADPGPGELPEELMTAEYGCGTPPGSNLSVVTELVDLVRREDRATIDRRVQKASKRADAAYSLSLSLALSRGGHADSGEKVSRWVLERFPTYAWAVMENAGALIYLRRWSDALEVLARINPDTLDPGREQHFHHLVAVAKLHLDEPEEALRAIKRGRAVSGGGCNLGCLFALAAPLGGEGETEAAWSAEQAAVRELVRAVASADALLSQGDAEGARIALDRRVVWEAREVQSLARLAEAHLAAEPIAPYDRFRKGLALAAFRAANGDRRIFMRREVPFPRARWGRSRLDALAERARAWLSEWFGDPMVSINPRLAGPISAR